MCRSMTRCRPLAEYLPYWSIYNAHNIPLSDEYQHADMYAYRDMRWKDLSCSGHGKTDYIQIGGGYPIGYSAGVIGWRISDTLIPIDLITGPSPTPPPHSLVLYISNIHYWSSLGSKLMIKYTPGLDLFWNGCRFRGRQVDLPSPMRSR